MANPLDMNLVDMSDESLIFHLALTLRAGRVISKDGPGLTSLVTVKITIGEILGFYYREITGNGSCPIKHALAVCPPLETWLSGQGDEISPASMAAMWLGAVRQFSAQERIEVPAAEGDDYHHLENWLVEEMHRTGEIPGDGEVIRHVTVYESNYTVRFEPEGIRKARYAAENRWIDSMIANEHDTLEEKTIDEDQMDRNIAKWSAMRPQCRRAKELAAMDLQPDDA